MVESGTRKVLRFSWPFSAKVRFFPFNVLLFSLSYDCICFTKLLRRLVKRWRSMSHCCFVYLADDISGLLERVSAIAVSLMHPHQKNLKSRGLKFNKEKESIQVGEWLGFVIDTISILRNSPSLRRSNLNSIILSRSVTVRVPARVAGFIIISLLLAVVPIAVDSFHYPRAVWL